MDLRELSAEDQASIATVVAIENACLVDAPWSHASTIYRLSMAMRHGWDGEVGRFFLVHADGVDEPVGRATLHAGEYDNLDLAWFDLAIAPAHRRRGYGSQALRQLCEEVRAIGRSKVFWFGWDSERTRGFARSLGFEPKSVAVCRRQHLGELRPGLADELYAEAAPYAEEYELLRVVAPTPDELMPALVSATAAINDAPLDDLDMEEDVFSEGRLRRYEQAQLDSGYRFYRILARHRGSGEIAGLTIATVDSETPAQGHQHDTSVVAAHRGHRLGQLLKADMMRWLAEIEPQLETVDTFNAESNAHMIAVNERLGYRVMARELQFQESI